MTERAEGEPAGGVRWRQPVGTWIRWSAGLKRDFLDRLAGTCNITAAAAAVGVSADAVHRLRRRDAAFATAWAEALEAGYALLETRLLGHALSGAARTDPLAAAGGTTEPLDVDLALRLLKERCVRRTGVRARRASEPDKLRRATEAETNAAILRLLRAGAVPVDAA